MGIFESIIMSKYFDRAAKEQERIDKLGQEELAKSQELAQAKNSSEKRKGKEWLAILIKK